jgi:hypothetical protein
MCYIKIIFKKYKNITLIYSLKKNNNKQTLKHPIFLPLPWLEFGDHSTFPSTTVFSLPKSFR